MRQTVKSVLQLLAILIGGLVAGSVFVIWRGYDPTIYSQSTFLEVHQQAVTGLNTLLPVMGAAAILLTLLLAFLGGRRHPALPYYALAIVAFAAAGLITRLGNQPINADVMDWSAATMPADWDAVRIRWFSWHKTRLAFSIAGFAFLVIGALVDARRQTAD
jgi:MFS superfamily sulfate permease-like transporter